MEVLFRKGLVAGIRVRAAASTDEICGLLLGSGTHVVDVVHCANVAVDPAFRFEVDPAALIAAYKEARAGGPAILGCYHSHPRGGPEPSSHDAAEAAPNGWLWLIVAGDRAELWRAVPDGERHGRFDPVAFVS